MGIGCIFCLLVMGLLAALVTWSGHRLHYLPIGHGPIKNALNAFKYSPERMFELLSVQKSVNILRVIASNWNSWQYLLTILLYFFMGIGAVTHSILT